MISLVLSVSPRELFLRLAGEAGISQAELDGGLTVREFQRRVALARDAACERDTERVLVAASSVEAFDEAPIVIVQESP